MITLIQAIEKHKPFEKFFSGPELLGIEKNTQQIVYRLFTGELYTTPEHDLSVCTSNTDFIVVPFTVLKQANNIEGGELTIHKCKKQPNRYRININITKNHHSHSFTMPAYSLTAPHLCEVVSKISKKKGYVLRLSNKMKEIIKKQRNILKEMQLFIAPQGVIAAAPSIIFTEGEVTNSDDITFIPLDNAEYLNIYHSFYDTVYMYFYEQMLLFRMYSADHNLQTIIPYTVSTIPPYNIKNILNAPYEYKGNLSEQDVKVIYQLSHLYPYNKGYLVIKDKKAYLMYSQMKTEIHLQTEISFDFSIFLLYAQTIFTYLTEPTEIWISPQVQILRLRTADISFYIPLHFLKEGEINDWV